MQFKYKVIYYYPGQVELEDNFCMAIIINMLDKHFAKHTTGSWDIL